MSLHYRASTGLTDSDTRPDTSSAEQRGAQMRKFAAFALALVVDLDC
jgi:hypothetical protein